MEARKEADKTTKREETPMTTSPLFGEFSGEVRCSSLSMLAFTAGLVAFYCLVSWHLLDAVLSSFAAFIAWGRWAADEP